MGGRAKRQVRNGLPAILDKGRNRIRLAKVARSATGVLVELMPPTPFTPEIVHGRVALDGVMVTSRALLPGDGYERYIKPFRTVEDAHVSAALLGYLLSVAYRYDWPREACAEIMGLVAGLREIALADPRAAAVHVALGGVLALQGRFLEMARVHWRLVDEQTRLQWERDEPIMNVAAGARARRFDVAWDRLATSASSLGKVAPRGGCPV